MSGQLACAEIKLAEAQTKVLHIKMIKEAIIFRPETKESTLKLVHSLS